MKHKVIINVSNSNHKEIQILKASRITIPRKIVQWLSGYLENILKYTY